VTDERTIEQRTMVKVAWRIVPLIVLIYFVAYIDRTNVGFAAISMNKDLGFSAYAYGWGAGIFFIGYFFFEVPSNIILHRVGARVWIARIMITWGIASGVMMFVTGIKSFLVLRFLLGVAEAGFFPGVLLYFTYWFPAAYRARVVSALFLAVPGSNAVAAAVSGAILQLDGVWGLAGWKWMFFLESVPALLLAPVVLLVLTDKPAVATWLGRDEREWLEERLLKERNALERVHKPLTLSQALTDKRVLGLASIYLANVSATYGITFFLPLIVKSHGLSNVTTGLVAAAPYTVGAAGMMLWAYSSDRTGERRWHLIVASLLGAIGLLAAGESRSLYGAIAAMSLASVGLYACKPCFWPLPSTFLSGTAAAGGIALVNAIGNLGGFVGPYGVGLIRDRTQSYGAGLDFLAACALSSGIIAYFLVKPTPAVVQPAGRVPWPPERREAGPRAPVPGSPVSR
jgi:ACS family tartrate transporter-like MFS transporter